MRELIINKILTLIYIPINKIIIDGLIKALTLVKFASFIEILELKNSDL